MDLKADPRNDFRRYAAGRWLDAATLPPDRVRISGIDVLVKRVDVQIQSVLEDATRAVPLRPRAARRNRWAISTRPAWTKSA